MSIREESKQKHFSFWIKKIYVIGVVSMILLRRFKNAELRTKIAVIGES